jgi:hypothetical protein
MQVNFQGSSSSLHSLMGNSESDRYFLLEFAGCFQGGIHLPAMVTLFLRDLGAEDSVNLESRFSQDGVFTDLNFHIILGAGEVQSFLPQFESLVPSYTCLKITCLKITEVEKEAKEAKD